MLIDTKHISDNDMKQINKYTRKDFVRDNIYAFTVTLCDNRIDKDFEMISTDCLYQLKKLALGSTGILTESKTAKIYGVNDRVTLIDNEYVIHLEAQAYMPKDCIKKEELEKILNDSEVSIVFSARNKTCSICGNNFNFCGHHKGQKYDNKLCYAILDKPTGFYEWSVIPKQQK